MTSDNEQKAMKSELILIDYSLKSYVSQFNNLLINGEKKILIRGITSLTIHFLKEVETYKSLYDYELFIHDNNPSSIAPQSVSPYNENNNNIDAVIIFIESSLDEVLCEFENKCGITCIAPNRKTHKGAMLTSIPKAGTNLLFNTVNVMGYEGEGEISKPSPKKYYTLGGTIHLTYDHFKNMNLPDRNFFHTHPALFIFRDPRDILLSGFNYVLKLPENNFHKYISKGKTPEDKFSLFLEATIETGFIGEEMVSYAHWLKFEKYNLLPIRFEEFIGPKGGGDLVKQISILWKLQLKLLIPGQTLSFAEKIFSPLSPTFFHGQIGSYKTFYTPKHKELFKRFNTQHHDVMKKFGYTYA